MCSSKHSLTTGHPWSIFLPDEKSGKNITCTGSKGASSTTLHLLPQALETAREISDGAVFQGLVLLR